MVQTRVAHYRRFIGEDEDGPTGEIWFDVERVDDLKSKQQRQAYPAAIRREFWGDEDPSATHPTRELTEKTYRNPTNSDQLIKIKAIDQMLTKSGQGPGFLKNTKRYRNHDNEDNTVRVFQIRRVYHADATIDADGKYVKQQPTAEDRKQYIDVALLKKIIQKTGQGPTYKLRTFLLNYEPLMEYSELVEDNVTTVGDGVVYLDPWQNVINVQWPDDDEGPDDDDEPEEPQPEFWYVARMLTGEQPPGGLIQVVEFWVIDDPAAGAALAAAYPLREPDPFHQIIMPHMFYGVYPDAYSAVEAQNAFHEYYIANQHEWPAYPPSETQVPGPGFVVIGP